MDSRLVTPIALFCILFFSFACNCKSEEDQGYGDEQEPQMSAAEQYIDFITGGGGQDMDLTGGGDGGGKGPHDVLGSGGTNQGDEEDNYGVETLNLLLRQYREKFEGLSIDKIKSTLMEDIKKMDQDEDGHISRGELISWLIEEAEKGSLNEAKQLTGFLSYDTDKDEKLSWEEILEDLKKLGSMSNPVFVRGLEMERVRFDVADQDKDGFLNESEYPYYATPEFFTKMDNYTLKSFIHDYDSDNDSKITEEEFLKAFDKASDEEGYKIELERFKSLDKNKDGVLTQDEIAHLALEFTLTTFIKQHADTIFMNVDTDNNGKLSSVEVITNYAMFTKGMPDNITAEDVKHDEL